MRQHFRVVLVSALVLAGCSGGGSHGALPPTGPAASGSQADLTPVAGLGASAPSGIRVVVGLPLRNEAQLDALIAAQGDKTSSSYRQYLTPAAFRAQFGPSAADLASVARTLTTAGFTTQITSLGVIADAPQATVEQTFGVRLTRALSSVRGSRTTLSKVQGTVRLPSALASAGATLVSLSGIELSRKSFRAAPGTAIAPPGQGLLGPDGPYFPSELRQAYRLPSYTADSGAGRTIAVIGPADFLTSDIAGLFRFEGFTSAPNVRRRPVHGGPPPFDPGDGNAVEIALDIQEALGAAPGAALVDYQLPDASDDSFLEGFTAIVEDNVADVVSSSFGICELAYLKAYTGVDSTPIVNHYHNLFRQGNAQGISFLSASGDFGSLDCADIAGGAAIPPAVDYPSSDPNVTGVGGTNLVTTTGDNGLQSTYVSESAFGDPLDPSLFEPGAQFASGGGTSVLFGRPLFQLLVNTGSAQRTVPDVAMQMGGCPEIADAYRSCATLGRSGSVIFFDGQLVGVVGTSSASPEFAGLLALTEGDLGGVRLGNANAYIYVLGALGASSVFHDAIPGNNGFPSHRGYNEVVGNGTPVGIDFALHPFQAAAGDTTTPSNP
ncbi:MAG: S53 family serine peptidase [Candidatus Velthaea sp.]|jgi:subtilase family serine protease